MHVCTHVQDRNEFLFDWSRKDLTFFAPHVPTPLDRQKFCQQLCCRLHNYCIFNHTAECCNCDKGVNPWAKATADKPCCFHHSPGKCFCDRVAMSIGQDESVYHAYSLGKKSWSVQKKVGLRKKSDGPGCHVSAFVGFALGFGLKIENLQEVIEEVNSQRKDGVPSQVDGVNKKLLKGNPAIRLMMIGAQREGWWDEVKLMRQCEDVLDVLETWDR